MVVNIKKIKVILISVLIVIEICAIFLMYKSFNNKKIVLDNVKLQKIKNDGNLAILLEQSDGTYKETSGNSWPDDMIFNVEKSGCVDNNGKKIENALTYENGIATVETGVTSNCYLYFDIESIGPKISNETHVGDGVISFTANDEHHSVSKYCVNQLDNSTTGCTWYNAVEGNNVTGALATDSGIYYVHVQDTLGNVGHSNSVIVVIEHKLGEYILENPTAGLNTSGLVAGMYRYQGSASDTVNNYICFGTADKDTCLANTDLYLYRILGITEEGQVKLLKETVLPNSSYWASNGDRAWPNSTAYAQVNGGMFLIGTSYVPSGWEEKIATMPWKYGDSRASMWTTGEQWYTIENGFTNSVNAKIGLMYAHDYLCTVAGCIVGSTATEYRNRWGYGAYSEWLITRYGANGSTQYDARYIDAGVVNYGKMASNRDLRPVFYLNVDEVYNGGTGTSNDPFILKFEGSGLCEKNQNIGTCLINNNSGISTLSDSLVGGLYRYQGTYYNVKDNYICFGTNNTAECIKNPSTYMYRIIGINSSGQLKLIKKEALDTTYSWYTDYSSNIYWPNSKLFGNLNKSIFVNNSVYPYMSTDNEWYNKIATTSWKYGLISDTNKTADNIYAEENGWAATVSAKIGLMYIHDYYYGLTGNLNCTNNVDADSCKNSWIHLWNSNNDSGAPDSTYEYTMSYYGASSSYSYQAWNIFLNGYMTSQHIHFDQSVRPVFYLNSDVTSAGGIGTLTEPFIIN